MNHDKNSMKQNRPLGDMSKPIKDMYPSELLAYADKLLSAEDLHPPRQESVEEEAPRSFEERVGRQVHYLTERMGEMPPEERTKYLHDQRQVARERALIGLEARLGEGNVTQGDVQSAYSESADLEAALRVSEGQLPDAPAVLSSRS